MKLHTQGWQARIDRVDAALGRICSTLVIKNAKIVNVFTKEILDGGVAIYDDRIVGVGDLPPGAIGGDTKVVDAGGKFLLPGFIDPHFHVGDTSLPIGALAAALIERGTTGLATDMCEMHGIGGVQAVRWAIDTAKEAGLRILFMIPLHSLGTEKFGSFAHIPTVDEYLEMADWSETVAVNEPPPNVVLARHEGVHRVLDRVLSDRKRFEGHAPNLTGVNLQAYIAAGSSSDHECVDADEAMEKLRLGYRILMRECSVSSDLRKLVRIVVERPETSRFFMVCTDDMQSKEFLRDGHIDHKLRMVMAAGVDPITAVQMATINVAEYFGLADDLGSISPGKIADFIICQSIEDLRDLTVFSAGRMVAETGRYLGHIPDKVEVPEFLKSRMNIGREIIAADFRIPAPIENGRVRVRVMGIIDGTLISDALEADLEVREGEILAQPENDILKIAIIDRHNASGALFCGFVSGFGLKSGALATTFFWQHFSLMIVGASDLEMKTAVEEMEKLGGGMLAVRGSDLLHATPFQIGGILGVKSLDGMAGELAGFEKACTILGSTLTDPFLSLAFASIPHIPSYGITDMGWYDTRAEEFVDIVIDVLETST
ncbi:adenine deaminase C-terminal domain-containing protein [Ancylobacter sp. G4_0304]|uniref:adenine deaminase C-terminal domain-containing protein n=1 Tax=Ancylobacter sp. G4_0304 TaxID=3114289 RepID=UPI0039C71294